MKIATDSRMSDSDESWSSFTVFSGTRMLSTIGHDLRHLYDKITEPSQPDDLMRLARLVDANRTRSDTGA